VCFRLQADTEKCAESVDAASGRPARRREDEETSRRHAQSRRGTRAGFLGVFCSESSTGLGRLWLACTSVVVVPALAIPATAYSVVMARRAIMHNIFYYIRKTVLYSYYLR